MIAATPVGAAAPERAAIERRAGRLAVEPIGVEEAWMFHHAHRSLTTPYTRPDFADLLAAGYGRSPLRLGVFGGAGIEAVVQLPLHRRGPLATADQTPFPYVGLMTDGVEHVPSQILAIRRALSRARVAFAVISLPPQLAVDPALLSGPGVYVHERTTCIVPTGAASVEAVAAQWSRSVHRATRDGLRIEAATAVEMSGALAQLTDQVVLRAQGALPGYSDAMWPMAWEVFRGDGDVFLRVAHAGGRIAGLMFSIKQGATMYADGIAVRPEIMGVLILDLARLAARHGCAWCDITGGPPNVVAFKQRWGAAPARYLDLHIKDPVLGLAHGAAQRAARIAGGAGALLGGRQRRG